MENSDPSHSLIILQKKLDKAIREEDWGGIHVAAASILSLCLTVTEKGFPGNAIIRLISEALSSPKPILVVPEPLTVHQELPELIKGISAIRSFIFALANGDLSKSIEMKGYIGGTLKMLQANLKHLTWQTQMVAQGDFTQHIDFMGEFSEAFNTMVTKLECAQRELKASEERYRNLAITDPLTGLANRRNFFDLAKKEFSKTERYSRSVAVIMLDIDHFKKVNDEHGHAAGDKVLQQVAARLKAALRVADISGRYGGEEFIALLPESNIVAAELVAERIRKSIGNDPMVIEGSSLHITASLGVSIYHGSNQITEISDKMLEKAIKQADQALYRAKDSGRNKVIIYN